MKLGVLMTLVQTLQWVSAGVTGVASRNYPPLKLISLASESGWNEIVLMLVVGTLTMLWLLIIICTVQRSQGETRINLWLLMIKLSPNLITLSPQHKVWLCNNIVMFCNLMNLNMARKSWKLINKSGFISVIEPCHLKPEYFFIEFK